MCTEAEKIRAVAMDGSRNDYFDELGTEVADELGFQYDKEEVGRVGDFLKNRRSSP